MTIKTSYFANWRNWPSDLQPTAICRILPEGAKNVDHELRLAPSQQLLRAYKHNTISEEDYTTEYLKYLNRFSPVVVGEALEGKLLLCYEKSSGFCHRHILAEWLRQAGVEIEEV